VEYHQSQNCTFEIFDKTLPPHEGTLSRPTDNTLSTKQSP